MYIAYMYACQQAEIKCSLSIVIAGSLPLAGLAWSSKKGIAVAFCQLRLMVSDQSSFTPSMTLQQGSRAYFHASLPDEEVQLRQRGALNTWSDP